MMSENSIGVPALSASRMSFAFAFGIGLLRARGGELRVEIAELLVRQRRVVVADEQIGLGRDIARPWLRPRRPWRAASRSRRRAMRRPRASGPAWRPAGSAGSLGDRVGDLRGKLRILRFELDRDDARFFDLESGEPIVIALEHPLLGRHAHRILDEPDEAEHGADQRWAAQHRVEFRPLAELELLDDFAREIARQHQLDLAGHRLLIDGRAAVDCLFRIRPQENVFARFDQDARFRLVARRDRG